MFYNLLKQVVRIYLRFLYKRIYFDKLDTIPDGVPVLIACNHNNAFADALFVGSFLSRLQMHFIVRGDVFNPKMMWFFRLTNQIPIFRFRDGYENMKKNNNTMEYCYNALSQNQRIIIFSEGDCVTENRLRPIQKGTARMAFGSYESHGVEELLIFPVGINYIEPTAFRSSVIVSVGEPIKMSDFLPAYKENPNKGIKEMTNSIEVNLKKHVIHIEKKDKEHLAHMAFRLIDNETGTRFFSFGKDSKLYNRMKNWVEKFNVEDEKENSVIIHKLKELYSLLDPSQVKINKPFLSTSFIINLLLYILLLPIGFISRTYFFIPLWMGTRIAQGYKPRKEFFISIRIGITWAILSLFILLTFIILSMAFNWTTGLIFLITTPIIAKIGVLWDDVRIKLVQKIKFMSLQDEEQEKINDLMTELGLTRE